MSFPVELAGLVRYYMQIKGNFDLTVVFTGVGIPTTLRKIDCPKLVSLRPVLVNFGQLYLVMPVTGKIRTWIHET